MGLKDHVIVGTERTVVAVIGDDRFKDRSVLETVAGVDKVVPILAPYKMASNEVKVDPESSPVDAVQKSSQEQPATILEVRKLETRVASRVHSHRVL